MIRVPVHIFNSVDDLIAAVAEHFVTIAANAISSRGTFNVALSGGSSPERLYQLLRYSKEVKWDRVNFFFGDERYVPFDHPENNVRMVKKALFDPLNIPASRIFSIDTSLPPEEAAKKYASAISSHFNHEQPRFDLILLGLGENAHTASLFPYTPVLDDQSASVKAVHLEEQQVYRITMTAPLINLAHKIAFLVYGTAKAAAVHSVLEGERDPKKYPAQLISSDPAQTDWYLDQAAASALVNAKAT